MNTQEVLSRFAIMANLTIEEASIWTTLCEDTIEELQKHIKDGIDEEKSARQLNAAAAALSFYKYTLYRASGMGMDAFSVGDISIKGDKKLSVQTAYKVWQEAKGSICDLIVDDGFIFEEIRAI